MGPEFIDVRLAPDHIQPASRADLDKEIEFRQGLLATSIDELLAATTSDVSVAGYNSNHLPPTAIGDCLTFPETVEPLIQPG